MLCTNGFHHENEAQVHSIEGGHLTKKKKKIKRVQMQLNHEGNGFKMFSALDITDLKTQKLVKSYLFSQEF